MVLSKQNSEFSSLALSFFNTKKLLVQKLDFSLQLHPPYDSFKIKTLPLKSNFSTHTFNCFGNQKYLIFFVRVLFFRKSKTLGLGDFERKNLLNRQGFMF